MKYTKAQRHKIYKKGLKKMTGRLSGGVWFICNALGSKHRMADLKDFPEVYEQRPSRFYINGDVPQWFIGGDSGLEIRKAILRKAIQQTKPKKKTK